MIKRLNSERNMLRYDDNAIENGGDGGRTMIIMIKISVITFTMSALKIRFYNLFDNI